MHTRIHKRACVLHVRIYTFVYSMIHCKSAGGSMSSQKRWNGLNAIKEPLAKTESRLGT